MMMVDPWIEKFKQQALPIIIREIRPEQCILFGSRARNSATNESDIDVILVARFFENIPFTKRMSYLLKLVRFEKHIDFLCYSPEEFERNKKTSAVIGDALSYGIWLKAA
jgi:predicted nucleotidyltransferase